MNLTKRIEINPAILKGKAVIKGTRLSVQYILGLLANGASEEEILDEYTNLRRDDILACLMFASNALDDHFFYPNAQDQA